MAKTNESEGLRKITIKAIGAAPDFEKLMKADGKSMKLATIYGIATRAKPGQSDLGAYVKFLGQFKATNLVTKQSYESNVILLPKFLEEQLFAALPEGAGNVEFAFEIGAKYDASAATKYVYTAKSLLPVQEAAQMNALEDKMKDAVKALADKSKS